MRARTWLKSTAKRRAASLASANLAPVDNRRPSRNTTGDRAYVENESRPAPAQGITNAQIKLPSDTAKHAVRVTALFLRTVRRRRLLGRLFGGRISLRRIGDRSLTENRDRKSGHRYRCRKEDRTQEISGCKSHPIPRIRFKKVLETAAQSIAYHQWRHAHARSRLGGSAPNLSNPITTFHTKSTHFQRQASLPRRLCGSPRKTSRVQCLFVERPADRDRSSSVRSAK